MAIPFKVVDRRNSLHPAVGLGFAITVTAAILGEWSLQEFCWSAWLAGLVYSWLCIAVTALRVLSGATGQKAELESALPVLHHIPSSLFILIFTPPVFLSAVILLIALAYIFSFYGLFLSVFAEMEPLELFGRNGFINSDFVTPVVFLAKRFWPMVLGTLLARVSEFRAKQGWQFALYPVLQSVFHMHILVLLLPFLMLLAWAILGEKYESAVIVLLSAILYYLPTRPGRKDPVGKEVIS